jgi:hypothetical protein
MWFPELVINLAIAYLLLDIATKLFNAGIVIFNAIQSRRANDL